MPFSSSRRLSSSTTAPVLRSASWRRRSIWRAILSSSMTPPSGDPVAADPPFMDWIVTSLGYATVPPVLTPRNISGKGVHGSARKAGQIRPRSGGYGVPLAHVERGREQQDGHAGDGEPEPDEGRGPESP